ncbi:MAG: GntR family transcriptional regulator [Pararhodobacter sp.]
MPQPDGAARVDRDQPLPLFLQIRRHLLTLIGEWPDPARRFHTEAELAAMFGVTKATVRHALSELAESGLIRRRRGAGTYVARRPHVEKLDAGLDIDRQYAARWGQGPAVTVLGFVTRPPTPAESRGLDLAPAAQVLAIRRLRALAHVPLAIDERVIEATLARRAGFTEANAEQPIVDRLRNHLGLGRAAWEISARRAGKVDAALLQIAPDDPLLVRAITYFNHDDKPVMLGETRHRSDLVRCGVELDLSPRSGDRPCDVRARASGCDPAAAPDAPLGGHAHDWSGDWPGEAVNWPGFGATPAAGGK